MSEDGPADVAMAYWPEVKAIPGAELTLATLAPDHRLYIATNASVSGRGQIELALERASLRQYVSDIFCYAEIGTRKESPEFWAAVMSKLRAAPSDLAMVGDSLEQDVIAPRAAGIFAVWFNEDGSRTPSLDVPVIRRLPDLVPLLRSRSG